MSAQPRLNGSPRPPCPSSSSAALCTTELALGLAAVLQAGPPSQLTLPGARFTRPLPQIVTVRPLASTPSPATPGLRGTRLPKQGRTQHHPVGWSPGCDGWPWGGPCRRPRWADQARSPAQRPHAPVPRVDGQGGGLRPRRRLGTRQSRRPETVPAPSRPPHGPLSRAPLGQDRAPRPTRLPDPSGGCEERTL